GLVVESGEPREVHHFALLLGYGASAINPYLAFESLHDLVRQKMLPGRDADTAEQKYVKAIGKGIVKVCSKMGISTIQSYHGAQVFEAIGLNPELIEEYFTWTASRVAGIGIAEIPEEGRGPHSPAAPHPPRPGPPPRPPRPAAAGARPRSRRAVPVPAWRRVPPLHPGDHPQAAARLPHRQLRRVQGVLAPHRRPVAPPGHAARADGAQVPPPAGADR